MNENCIFIKVDAKIPHPIKVLVFGFWVWAVSGSLVEEMVIIYIYTYGMNENIMV
jgi:hypothetical protein